MVQYLALTDGMVLTLSDLFESIAEDPTAWANDVRDFLPKWLFVGEPEGNLSSTLSSSESEIVDS